MNDNVFFNIFSKIKTNFDLKHIKMKSNKNAIKTDLVEQCLYNIINTTL
ncbi:hypothetical protein M153_3230002435 [Pseudoloma neurophilia]|uniref:Uncharacterized protein n=1 Tax=Pseudoloma neurophilia TaxID=146866 RepID=A0A0R0M485_9MICR|nr:hypothetical protein M153_3230002435 [Pseudoloma neurophilia]